MPELIDTLARLVSINSINPEWNGPGEAEAATFVHEFFAETGIETEYDKVLPGRPNVMARIPGQRSEGGVVLEAHLDTVSVDGMSIPPFEPRVEGGRLFGRGACDTKGGLAAMMHAVRSLVVSGETPPRDVWFAAVIDEEHAFRGVLGAIERLRKRGAKPGGCVVAEPTNLRAVRANKGVLRWKIETLGKSSHSSKPHLGVNAIVAMARVIERLEKRHALLAEKAHPLLGAGTCCISLIRGGDQVNFVPSRCGISLDRRLLPGESGEEIIAEYRSLVSGIEGVEALVHPPDLLDEAMETPESDPVVVCSRNVLQEMNLDPEPCGVPFGCDVTKFSRAGIPGIIFGPGSIDQAHGSVEYVDVNEVELAFDFYRRFLLNYGR